MGLPRGQEDARQANGGKAETQEPQGGDSTPPPSSNARQEFLATNAPSWKHQGGGGVTTSVRPRHDRVTKNRLAPAPRPGFSTEACSLGGGHRGALTCFPGAPRPAAREEAVADSTAKSSTYPFNHLTRRHRYQGVNGGGGGRRDIGAMLEEKTKTVRYGQVNHASPRPPDEASSASWGSKKRRRGRAGSKRNARPPRRRKALTHNHTDLRMPNAERRTSNA